MKLMLTGEDGCTFYFLTNPKLRKNLLDDLRLNSIEKIWFRPSFGRAAGASSIPEERGYSGFGESDAIIIGEDSNQNKNFVFIESKMGCCQRSKISKNQLEYQFFLKLCLVNSILNPVQKTFGKNKTSNTYYCVDLPIEDSNFLESKLKRLYHKYKAKAPPRKNGWCLAMNSKNSPALKNIEDAIKNRSEKSIYFRFYALGFTQKICDSDDGYLRLFENMGLDFSDEIKNMFMISENGIPVKFRNITIPEPIEYEIAEDVELPVMQQQLQDGF